MLLGLEVVTLDVPGEDGEWMRVRTRLSEYAGLKAKVADQQQAMRLAAPIMNDIGPETFQEIIQLLDQGASPEQVHASLAAPAETPPEPPQATAEGDGEASAVETPPPTPPAPTPPPAAPAGRSRGDFDMDVLALEAIEGWSYTYTNRRGATAPAHVTLENVRRLDRKTRAWIHDLAWEALEPDAEETVAKNS